MGVSHGLIFKQSGLEAGAEILTDSLFLLTIIFDLLNY